MNISDASYLLFVIPGAVFIWTFRHFAAGRSKIGEFEYAIWSFIWGSILFLTTMKVVQLTGTNLPDIPLDNPAATLGSFTGISLVIASGFAIPLGWLLALVSNTGLFAWADKLLKKFANF